MNEQFDYDITPIFYNNAWQQNFVADLMSLASKWHVQPGMVKCTVFLASRSGSASLLPLDGEWTNIGDPGDAQIFDTPAFPMPNATGVDLSLAEYYESAKPAKVGVSANSTGIHTLISWPSGEPTSTTTVRVTLRLGTSSVMQYSKEETYTPGGFMQLIYWTWSELGMLYYQGMQITLSVSVQTAIQGSSKWTNGEGFSGTITAK